MPKINFDDEMQEYRAVLTELGGDLQSYMRLDARIRDWHERMNDEKSTPSEKKQCTRLYNRLKESMKFVALCCK